MNLPDLLKATLDLGGSDLHLSIGAAPQVRVDGHLRPLEQPVLTPDATKAFESVEYIMRDVPWGWLIRYMHSTGASAFFVVVYLHMFRGLLYGSYRKPRELVWIFGCLIFLTLMAEAFFGYLLPWGQMSYWGAQVIVNLFQAIPLIESGAADRFGLMSGAFYEVRLQSSRIDHRLVDVRVPDDGSFREQCGHDRRSLLLEHVEGGAHGR